jgi:hypothetical protein
LLIIAVATDSKVDMQEKPFSPLFSIAVACGLEANPRESKSGGYMAAFPKVVFHQNLTLGDARLMIVTISMQSSLAIFRHAP